MIAAADTPARATTLLRNACQRALTFFCEGPRASNEQKGRDNKSAGMAQQIEIQMRLALDAAFDTESFNEVAAAVLAAPGIDSCFITQTVSLDREPVGKVPGGAGAYVYGHFCRDAYRVFLHTGTKHTEASHADLLTAVREAFEKLALPLPPALVRK